MMLVIILLRQASLLLQNGQIYTSGEPFIFDGSVLSFKCDNSAEQLKIESYITDPSGAVVLGSDQNSSVQYAIMQAGNANVIDTVQSGSD